MRYLASFGKTYVVDEKIGSWCTGFHVGSCTNERRDNLVCTVEGSRIGTSRIRVKPLAARWELRAFYQAAFIRAPE